MAIEIPYILVQAILYVSITYPMIGFYWSAPKFFWYFYTTFCTFLYFVYLGMLITSISANLDLASVLSTAVYTIFNLFSGFLMPGPVSVLDVQSFLSNCLVFVENMNQHLLLEFVIIVKFLMSIVSSSSGSYELLHLSFIFQINR